jgi:acyl transferase domain-containing protein
VDLSSTGNFEFRCTDTRVGDPTEVGAIPFVFAPQRAADVSLILGFIKSNLSHTEHAAGLNVLLKASPTVGQWLAS